MNDDTDKPLNPVGDAALEARITAWVLGEASPFEAAELEEICARDPEARLFERRLRVLHGFITADRKAGPEDEWKLPKEKREKVEALFEQREVVKDGVQESPKIVHRGQTGRRVLLALAACTVISVATWTLFKTAGVGEKASFAAMRMEAPQETVEFAAGGGGGGFGGGMGEGRGVILPAPPVARSRAASPMADRAPAAQPPADVDSLAAIEGVDELKSERGGAVDESLFKLSEKRETARSKSSAAGPPVKKPATSNMHLAQNSPFTTKPMPKAESAPAAAVAPAEVPAPATPPVTATGAVALNDFADHGGFGLDASAARDGKPANMDHEITSRFARPSGGGGAVAAPSDTQTRFQSWLSSADAGAPVGGPVAGGGGVTDAPAQPASGPGMRAFTGVWSSGQQAPAEPAGLLTDAAQGGLNEDLTLQMNGSVTEGSRSGLGAINRNSIDAILNNTNRVDANAPAGAKKDLSPGMSGAAAGKDGKLNSLSDRQAAGERGALTQVIEGVGEVPMLDAERENSMPSMRFERGTTGQATMLDLPAPPTAPRGGQAEVHEGFNANATDKDAWMGRVGGKDSKELADAEGTKGAKGDVDPGYHYFDSSGGLRQGDGFKDLAKMGEAAKNVGETPEFGLNLRLGAERSDSRAEGKVTSGIDSLTDLAGKQEQVESNPVGGTTNFNFDGFTNMEAPIAGKPADGYSGMAQKEMIRRQNAVATSDKLREEARAAQAKGDFKQAVEKLKESESVLPEAPMVNDRRAEVKKQLAETSVELGEQYRKDGKYEEARQLASDLLEFDAKNAGAKRIEDDLGAPTRTSQPLTDEQIRNTDEVRRKLYIAEGNSNLGKFDDAHRTYEDVLRIDPYNKAARRGMEEVSKARTDYYRAAYDQTRAGLLAQVDRAWEMGVPPVDQDASKELKKGKEVESEVSSLAKSAGNPAELMPKLEKAIREGEERLMRDPNSTEVQGQLQLLAKVRDDLRGEIEAKAKGDKLQEQNKAPAPVLPAETLTSAEPFSTFSLHVSDASFKMAKAALDRGEVPAADGIRPEEFYNAFDFGDPAPANGEPVVCAVEQSAHPALPQRNLLRIGVKTGSQGRGGSTPLNLTLLLDSSGSMEREDRNAGLANAVKQLSGLLKEGDTVSVIGFARQPRLLVDRLPGNRAQELNAIFAQTPPEGGTNLEEGIKLGEELAMRQFNPAAQNRIVLFTDGAANLGDAKPETLQAKVEHMRQNGIAFDAAGFGTDGLNDKLLERLTRNGNGRYYIVDRAEDADASFAKQLAGAFHPAAENVKVQVRFNPARVAKYKLIGFEEHRLKKEDFRNDAVDAAEMAAEEAGNALYQIEALPQGEGEVGEVSVRFRDAASGQMVERTWTIPYEAQAPSFDQATPSIQLAGLAAFAAEKLRAAPMADAVDFQRLAPVMAKVKARYASSKPVAELEAMIGKLK